MADIYSPWMASEEEDVTTQGLVTPEFMEMYAEAQAGPGSEAELDMETEPEMETPEEDMADIMPEPTEPNEELMAQAVSTMQQQTSIIDKLLTLLTNG